MQSAKVILYFLENFITVFSRGEISLTVDSVCTCILQTLQHIAHSGFCPHPIDGQVKSNPGEFVRYTQANSAASTCNQSNSFHDVLILDCGDIDPTPLVPTFYSLFCKL